MQACPAHYVSACIGTQRATPGTINTSAFNRMLRKAMCAGARSFTLGYDGSIRVTNRECMSNRTSIVESNTCFEIVVCHICSTVCVCRCQVFGNIQLGCNAQSAATTTRRCAYTSSLRSENIHAQRQTETADPTPLSID